MGLNLSVIDSKLFADENVRYRLRNKNGRYTWNLLQLFPFVFSLFTFFCLKSVVLQVSTIVWFAWSVIYIVRQSSARVTPLPVNIKAGRTYMCISTGKRTQVFRWELLDQVLTLENGLFLCSSERIEVVLPFNAFTENDRLSLAKVVSELCPIRTTPSSGHAIIDIKEERIRYIRRALIVALFGAYVAVLQYYLPILGASG